VLEAQALEKERVKDWTENPHFTIRCVPRAEEIERLEVYAQGG